MAKNRVTGESIDKNAQLLKDVADAVADARKQGVPLEEIAKAVTEGLGVIEGPNPFRSQTSTKGWGG